MPRIVEKGINGPPITLAKDNEEVYNWLSQLQMRFPKMFSYSQSIDLASIGATSYSTQTFTVNGLDVNDVVTVNPPELTSGLYLVSYRVSSANTLSMSFYNSTGSPIDEAAGTYKIVATRI